MKRVKQILCLLFLLLLCSCNKASMPEQTENSPINVQNETLTYTPEDTASSENDSTEASEDYNDTTTIQNNTDTSDSSNEKKEHYLLRAKEILSDMTLAEKVGQMFLVRFPGIGAIDDITKYQFGGVIFFAVDFENETKESFLKLTDTANNAAGLPLITAVDEEGGTVVRASKFTAFRDTPFLSPQELYQMGGLNTISADAQEKADFLSKIGINVCLAPVCDISTNPSDFMYSRTIGQDAEGTSAYVKTVVDTLSKNKIGTTLKHFPGYGNNADTHTGIAIDNRSEEEFKKNDFLPFLEGIKAGADGVMVSHNIVTCFDNQYPASLSSAVHEILRNELNFDGVILTDDLTMSAITDYTEGETAAVTAVLAGNDMLIITDYKAQIPAVIDAVNSGIITVERIDESVLRILSWKLSLGLLE